MSAAGSAFVAWGLEALIASTLLMALVMALRASVRRAFGAQIAYALWALPLLRLLLPPLPESWREVAATPITRAGETVTMIVAPEALPHGTVQDVAAAATGPSLLAIVAAVWIGGAALFLVWHFLRHARFCRNIVRRGVPVDRIARVRIIESEAAPGPLAFGIVRPCIAFPRDFAERYDADERALALAHELGHHARGDLIANWAALIVLALHWFNPVAWRAFHAFRADQELANDARVLAGRPVWERHAYACAIVKAAHGGTLSAACHLHSVRDLKGRLKMLTTSRASRRRIVGGAVSVAALAVFGLALTASGTRATAAFAERMSDTIGVDLPRTAAVVAAPETPEASDVSEASLAPVAATMPETPEAPDLPEAGPVPPMPPVPPVTHGSVTTTRDGRTIATSIERSVVDGRVVKNVNRVIVRGPDGKVISDRSTDLGAFRMVRDMPQVSSTNCDRDGKMLVGDEMVVRKVQNGRKTIVICTDRIARASESAARAQVDARRIQREAMETASASLRTARASIEHASRHMSEADRREALADLDEAEAEIRAEAVKND